MTSTYILFSVGHSYDLVEGGLLPLLTREGGELIGSPIVDKTQQLYLKQNWRKLTMIRIALKYVPYSGKLSREKNFMNFAIYSHPRKFSPRNFRHAIPTYAISLTFRKSFLCKMLPSYRSAKVSCYTVLYILLLFVLYMKLII